MAAAFVGLDVQLFLRNGTTISGNVKEIDQDTQMLTLSDVTILSNGKSRQLSSHHVPGAEIADLQLRPKAPKTAQQEAPHITMPPQQHAGPPSTASVTTPTSANPHALPQPLPPQQQQQQYYPQQQQQQIPMSLPPNTMPSGGYAPHQFPQQQGPMGGMQQPGPMGFMNPGPNGGGGGGGPIMSLVMGGGPPGGPGPQMMNPAGPMGGHPMMMPPTSSMGGNLPNPGAALLQGLGGGVPVGPGGNGGGVGIGGQQQHLQGPPMPFNLNIHMMPQQMSPQQQGVMQGMGQMGQMQQQQQHQPQHGHMQQGMQGFPQQGMQGHQQQAPMPMPLPMPISMPIPMQGMQGMPVIQQQQLGPIQGIHPGQVQMPMQGRPPAQPTVTQAALPPPIPPAIAQVPQMQNKVAPAPPPPFMDPAIISMSTKPPPAPSTSTTGTSTSVPSSATSSFPPALAAALGTASAPARPPAPQRSNSTSTARGSSGGGTPQGNPNPLSSPSRAVPSLPSATNLIPHQVKARNSTTAPAPPPRDRQNHQPPVVSGGGGGKRDPQPARAVGPFLTPPQFNLTLDTEDDDDEEAEVDFAEYVGAGGGGQGRKAAVRSGASGGRRSGSPSGKGNVNGSGGRVVPQATAGSESRSRSGRGAGSGGSQQGKKGAKAKSEKGSSSGRRQHEVVSPSEYLTRVGLHYGLFNEDDVTARRVRGDRGGGRRTGRNPNEWADGDVHDLLENDFDFEASLQLFDKSQVFAEIRESDATDPETLLVSHNRLPRHGNGHNEASSSSSSLAGTVVPGSVTSPAHHHHHHHHHGQGSPGGANMHQYYHAYQSSAPKLGPREMVLDDSEANEEEIEPSGDETGNDAEVESGIESDAALAYVGNGGVVPGGVELLALDDFPEGVIGSRGRRPQFVTAGKVAVVVPSVTPREMMEVERIAVNETGPSEEQMIENGGRGAAMLALQILTGRRRGNGAVGGSVVVLAGNNKTGAFGLAMARHLANHEVSVVVCAVGGETEVSNVVAYQRKIYLPTGGRLVRETSELPLPQAGHAVDLIVDSLLGPHQSILDLPSEHDRLLVCDLMKWTNESKCSIMSLDVPSGISGHTGIAPSPAHFISPRWTLALGLPKTGLISREVTGEVLLADLGIPKIVFMKVGRAGSGAMGVAGVGPLAKIRYAPPFGDKYLVGLAFAEGRDDDE
ncbi:enhancer of mRNA decapping [Irineochytrium annulatum]|nr:enhancer of mRNA decapping [Irineochytrium annulatum]